MKIALFGVGYVGLVTGACLADTGHDVVCVDIDARKIADLCAGKIPIFEPGLEELVKHNFKEKRLKFTLDAEQAIQENDVIFIAVGTPPQEDGSPNLSSIFAIADTIAKAANRKKFLILKSTSPVGTCDALAQHVSARTKYPIELISNPEFLKEGCAVADFMKPDRIVVGCTSSDAKEVMKQIYSAFTRNHDCMMYMDARSSELTKYAANAMLATKISFINEISNIAERSGADIELVRLGIGSDPRIGYDFIYPGCGYGGSCFPKDVSALIRTSEKLGYSTVLLEAVNEINNNQKNILFKKISAYFGGRDKLRSKSVAIWGLAFKPKTDDLREASSLRLINSLIEAGATVNAYDPVANENAALLYAGNKQVKFFAEQYQCLEGADVLVICTEWPAFRNPDLQRIKAMLCHPAIFDGRNIYNPVDVAEAGLNYFAIGRGVPLLKGGDT